MSEPRAPYGQPQANPPDLAVQLRPALERLGFAVQQLDSPTQTLLVALWGTGEPPDLYQLTYTHHHPAGGGSHLSYVSLRLLGHLTSRSLVTDTHVRKLSEVRLLLLNNRRYKAARAAALAAGTLQPA